MKYMENQEHEANITVRITDCRTGRITDEFYFFIDFDNPLEYPRMVKYVCNNHQDAIDISSRISFHNPDWE